MYDIDKMIEDLPQECRVGQTLKHARMHIDSAEIHSDDSEQVRHDLIIAATILLSIIHNKPLR